jgi:hypothetical protein
MHWKDSASASQIPKHFPMTLGYVEIWHVCGLSTKTCQIGPIGFILDWWALIWHEWPLMVATFDRIAKKN